MSSYNAFAILFAHSGTFKKCAQLSYLNPFLIFAILFF